VLIALKLEGAALLSLIAAFTGAVHFSEVIAERAS
jgi:hypothetical protein